MVDFLERVYLKNPKNMTKSIKNSFFFYFYTTIYHDYSIFMFDFQRSLYIWRLFTNWIDVLIITLFACCLNIEIFFIFAWISIVIKC